MEGILYGVGVGPGDPELMTVKAVKTIRETDVIACPGENAKETTAFQIAVQMVPELETKTLLPLDMPMVMSRDEQKKHHRAAAVLLEEFLRRGTPVVFLTLGDPTIYSTFTYIQQIVEADGFEVRLISGVPSFCAAAAALKIPLSEWSEPIHILPAVHDPAAVPDQDGTCVLMKSGSRMKEVRNMLQQSGRRVYMAENCGMPEEKLYFGADEIPEDAGYFSLVIAK